jgi:hypothetical protein
MVSAAQTVGNTRLAITEAELKKPINKRRECLRVDDSIAKYLVKIMQPGAA